MLTHMALPSANVPKPFRNGPEVTIPLSMFLNLHNALPRDHEMRGLLREYIHAYANSNEKAHWTRAVVAEADGTLRFDESLYDVAVYRGKQETWVTAAAEAFDKLQQQLEFLATFQQEESAAANRVAEDIKPLVPLPDYSSQLAKLQGHGMEMSKLADTMRQGLASSIAGANMAKEAGHADE